MLPAVDMRASRPTGNIERHSEEYKVPQSSMLTTDGMHSINQPSCPSIHSSMDKATSKPSLTKLDIPRLKEQWIEKYSDILGPIPLELPPLREVNHHIPLINEDMRYNFHLPRCPEALETELREKTNRYLSAGWWEMKAVSQAAPLLCVPKKSGKLRTVVDGRKRNDNTYKDVTPFPDQDQIRMDVARGNYRTKIDMSDAYEQIRVEPSDVWKTAFATPLGTYVSHVMQQGDCNAPATFQRLMTWIFRNYLGLFIRVYLDDIFVHSDTIEEHEEHLGIAFEVIREQRLFLSRPKLDMYSEDMDCLGHRIDDRGLHADSDKMGRILEWRTPRSQHEVQRFVGLVQYIAHFMPDVSAYTSVLESICRNGQLFYWRPIHQTCLDRIKDLARKTPILRPIDVRRPDPIWVIVDASAFGIGGLYGQGPDWQTCRPAGFMSKKFTSAQRSYRTFEHEALAVIEALMKWEDKLVGRQFRIVTDHEALETIKTSNRDGKSGRLIRWDEYLSRFQFTVQHVPGVLNKVADCLSRYYENDRSDEMHASHHYVSADVRLDPNREDLTELRLAEIDRSQEQLLSRRLRDRSEDRVIEAETIAKAVADQDAASVGIIVTNDDHDITVGEALQDGPLLRGIVMGDQDFVGAVKAGYVDDSVFKKVIDNPHHYPTFRVADGLVHTKNRLGDECICIPRTLFRGKRSLPEIVIDHAHTTLGHLGPQRTSEYARRWFWWPRMGRDIEKFCLSCGTCHLMKTSNKPKSGLLHSLPVPTRPWQSIAMDFVGPFPQSGEFDYLWVVLCRLTTLVHLVPVNVHTKTVDLAWFYTRDVVRLHGMPESIVSDRDSKFTAKFWRELHRAVGTKLLMSTSFHPQTDGHSERTNRSIGQMLRSMISPDQRDWVSKIPLIEFALNSSINSSTGFAAFELTYGYMPRIVPFPTEDIQYPGVREFAQRARANLEMAHDAIIEARVTATYHANRHRTEELPYEEGDMAYLSTVNLNLPKRRARKLAPKFIGPFKVIKAYPKTSNYELELSPELIARRIHPMFHASLLRPFEPNDDLLFPSRESKHFYDFGMPDDDEWFVDEIVGHRFTGASIEFNVRWTAGDHTWEPYSGVRSLAALDQYYALMGVTRWQSLRRKPTGGTLPRPHLPDKEGLVVQRRSSRRHR